jgi:3-methylcrotonyl-CoA carboxylase alpha subunit
MSVSQMFQTILIANRGEIACRIIATCRRLDVACVAVYSQADVNARHVRLADRAVCIGAAPARDSYLRADRIIEAARRSGALAIHPGYGFLAENPEFAEQCAAAGLVFIGPTLEAMRAMSSKAAAKRLMEQAGVPVLPGYHGEEQSVARLRREAARIGYPVLIKASAGGGGKGMRVVEEPALLEERLAGCRREALASFGDERVLLEKYLLRPRHIEVQLFGDSHGGLVHLHERDCSVQRRHQKVIEEAPASTLSPAQRTALTQAALAAGRAVAYVGAGTVEFLLDELGNFYFLEMNTRIQVEHPVTEMITGIDLVEWQLRVAAGSPLPLTQDQISCAGHSIEARLYAETPENGFLPATGTLRQFQLPAATQALRLETGVSAGDSVGIDYDPLLAKLIVHAPTRPAALEALRAALAQARIAGVQNNLLWLRRLAASTAFRDAAIDTGFIERERAWLTVDAAASDARVLAAAALWIVQQERAAGAGHSPWAQSDGWRLNGILQRTLRFEVAGMPSGSPAAAPLTVQIEYQGAALQVSIAGMRLAASLQPEDDGLFRLQLGDESLRLRIEAETGPLLHIELGMQAYRLRHLEALREPLAESEGAALTGAAAAPALNAPMPGRIIAQLVQAGERVEQGAPLLIMEAMKMEHALCAPAPGAVRRFLAEVGEQVPEGARLIEFEPQA